MQMSDLTGRQFGMLTVLRQFRHEKGYYVCECRCACGTIKKICKGNITSGRTKSCGCLEAKNRKSYRDLRGQRFGRLIAAEPTDARKDGNVVWKCVCDCGCITYTPGRSLTSGFVKSCGCYLTEKMNIAGRRFGRLVALHPEKSTLKGARKWICRCDCGTLCSVSISNLKNGHTKSCGCLCKEEYRMLVDGTCLELISSDKLPKNNRSGVKGVSYNSDADCWVATLTFRGQYYYLGRYKKLSEAASARKRAEEQLIAPFLAKYQHLLVREEKQACV